MVYVAFILDCFSQRIVAWHGMTSKPRFFTDTEAATGRGSGLTPPRASLDLHDGHSAAAFTDLAAEIATEVRLLSAIQAELADHAEQREARYHQVDPNGLARSLPGSPTWAVPPWSPRSQTRPGSPSTRRSAPTPV
jgi:hypothetical protein